MNPLSSNNTSPIGSTLNGPFFSTSSQVLSRVFHWKRNLASRFYPYALLAFDIALLAGIYLLSVAFRYDGDVLHDFSKRVLAVLIASNVLGLYLIGGYNYQTDKRTARFFSEHLIVSIIAAMWVVLNIYAFTFYGRTGNTARTTIFIPVLAFPLLSMGYRYTLGRIKAALRQGNALCVIGTGPSAVDLYKRIRASKSGQEIVVGDSDPERIGNRLIEDDAESPIVRPLDMINLNSSIRGKFVESYIIAKPFKQLPEPLVRNLAIAQFGGNRVYTYETYLGDVLKMVPPTELTLEWAFQEGFLLNRSVTYDRFKRLCDIFAALIGLLLCAPIMCLTALAVKLSSPGPVIFRQVRVGQKEKPLMLLKFRSMRVGSDKGPKYTAVGDSRITPVGHFLRKSRLDELPQLLNVLRGELSLIGPRAEWIDLVKEYEKKVPYYHFRHAVKPGITGWAQVNYSYGANLSDTIEKLYYDLYYVRKFSPMLDLSICVKTVYTMLFGKGQ